LRRLTVLHLWSPCVIGQTIFSSCFFLLYGRPPYVIGHAIIFLPCGFFLSSFFLSSPNLSGRRLDVYHTLTRGPSANLECRSEMCCTWLAESTGRKNDAINRHLNTIPQFCRTISSQLRHVSTIGKKIVKQRYLLYMSLQYGELRPTSG